MAGVYLSNQLIGNYLVDDSAAVHFQQQLYFAALVKAADGTDVAALRGPLDKALAAYPNVQVQDRVRVRRRQRPSRSTSCVQFFQLLLALAVGHRDPRHRQHAGAVGAGADPGARAAAGGRDEPAAGQADGPGRVGAGRGVRRRCSAWRSAWSSAWRCSGRWSSQGVTELSFPVRSWRCTCCWPRSPGCWRRGCRPGGPRGSTCCRRSPPTDHRGVAAPGGSTARPAPRCSASARTVGWPPGAPAASEEAVS